jgi:threonine/homoserine/homoserine lactone efflux protein
VIVFVLAVAAILAMPGPTNALLCTSAGLVGIRRSLRLILAEIAGYLVTITAIISLAGPIILAIPTLGIAVRLMLVAYLLLLAWRLWRTDPSPQNGDAHIVTIAQVFVATLLNPKALVFAFTVFPPFATPMAALPHMAAFTATVAVVACGWLVLGGTVGRVAQGRWNRFLPRAAAAVIGVLASIIASSAIAASL